MKSLGRSKYVQGTYCVSQCSRKCHRAWALDMVGPGETLALPEARRLLRLAQVCQVPSLLKVRMKPLMDLSFPQGLSTGLRGFSRGGRVDRPTASLKNLLYPQRRSQQLRPISLIFLTVLTSAKEMSLIRASSLYTRMSESRKHDRRVLLDPKRQCRSHLHTNHSTQLGYLG